MIDQTKSLVEEWYPQSEVIYGDTDSVMVIFHTGDKTGQAMLEESFRLGEEAAERISKTFKYTIELEFEKCYWPYLLFSKKRYAGLMYTRPEKPEYIDAKGIQLVRRDNASFVREISKKVLDMIMYKQEIVEAIQYVQQEAQRLLDHKVPIEQLIVSKYMRKNYKNNNQPHLEVAKKIEMRTPGSGPKCGERVPYVIMDTNNKKHLQFQKAEDPTFVIENKLERDIDVLYYLERSVISPVQSLFELFIEDPGKNLFGEMIRTYQKKRAGQTDITSFFNSSSSNNKTLEVKKPVVLPTASAVAKTKKCVAAKKKADKEVSDSKQRKLTMFI